MRRRGVKIFLCSVLVWSLLLTGYVCAVQDDAALDISRTGIGARPLGLGRAYTAVADDANAIFMNPAGLGYFTSPKALSIRSQVLQDVNYSTYALAWPTSLGTFGFGYVDATIDKIYLAEWQGGVPVITGEASYANSLFIASYGKVLSRELSFGANLKQFHQQFAGLHDPEAAAHGSNFDLGLLYRPNQKWSVGLMYQNAYTNPTLQWDNGGQEMLESHMRLGIAYQDKRVPNWFDMNRVIYAFDVDVPVAQSYRFTTYYLGAEAWFHDMFAIRAGASTRETQIAGRMQNVIEPAFGVGLNLWGFQVDYTYIPGVMDLGDKAAKYYLSIAYQLPDKEMAGPTDADEISATEDTFNFFGMEGTVPADGQAAQTAEPVVIKMASIERPYYGNAEIAARVLHKNVITVRDILKGLKYDPQNTYFEFGNGEQSRQVRLDPGENWFRYYVNGREYISQVLVIKDYADVTQQTPGYSAIQSLTMGGVLGGYQGGMSKYAPYVVADRAEFEHAVDLVQQGRYRTPGEMYVSDQSISRREAAFMMVSRFGGELEDYIGVFSKQVQNEILQGNEGGQLLRYEMAKLLLQTGQAKERLQGIAQDYDVRPYQMYFSGMSDD